MHCSKIVVEMCTEKIANTLFLCIICFVVSYCVLNMIIPGPHSQIYSEIFLCSFYTYWLSKMSYSIRVP